MAYIISIDQSTSCTKALLFDSEGNLFWRTDLPHNQIVNDKGWVEHDPNEIFRNLIGSVKKLVEESKVNTKEIKCAAISNQRETALAWNRKTGEPVYNAIVWQCDRAKDICDKISNADANNTALVKERTGINLSPYFSAGKLAWILQNVPLAKELARQKNLICSTMDSWLVFKLTKERNIKTDFSNASRTQLLNINSLSWDQDICKLFGLSTDMLPEICDSDSLFGMTDFDGALQEAVPIYGVMGDSHGALFAQGCLEPGMVKATYGTGSSVMLNIGEKPIACKDLVTSLAWGINGKINYVLEGNINYTGATIQWLKDDLKLIQSAKESGQLSLEASHSPGLYLIPAFSGLGAPYWNNDVRAMVVGMSRTTGKAEFVRAAEESIAYQITDILELMKSVSGFQIKTLRVDGGPSNDNFLMQFQSDMAQSEVRVARMEELSGFGPAIASGLKLGIYDKNIFLKEPKKLYTAKMHTEERNTLYGGWKHAIEFALKY